MRPRATWKGYLALASVTCAVALYSANNTGERTSFHLINRKTGNRLRQQMVDKETGEPVAPEDIRRGYEISPGQHVVLEDEEIEAVRIPSSGTIDVERFVRIEELDQIYLDGSYYLVPDGPLDEDAFVLIREAMRIRERSAIARIVLGGRERILALTPRGRGMLATTVRYPYEVMGDAEVFSSVSNLKIPKDMMTLALKVVDQRTKKFKPEKYEDRYEKALVSMIKEKQRGAPARKRAGRKPVVHSTLLQELKDSLSVSVPD
jgi:DNA end-binding protein Ku